MKRIVATSVMGAFLLSAPLAFALDKVPADPIAKEPAKTETAPMAKKVEPAKAEATLLAKKAEADKAVTPPAADKTDDSKALSAKQTPALKGQAAPLEVKAAKDSKATAKVVKKTSKQSGGQKENKPLEVSAQAAKVKAN